MNYDDNSDWNKIWLTGNNQIWKVLLERYFKQSYVLKISTFEYGLAAVLWHSIQHDQKS